MNNRTDGPRGGPRRVQPRLPQRSMTPTNHPSTQTCLNSHRPTLTSEEKWIEVKKQDPALRWEWLILLVCTERPTDDRQCEYLTCKHVRSIRTGCPQRFQHETQPQPPLLMSPQKARCAGHKWPGPKSDGFGKVFSGLSLSWSQFPSDDPTDVHSVN